MRIYRESIEVQLGLVDHLEGPAAFCWRGWWWRIDQVQQRWVLTAPWWESPAARAVRDGSVRLEDRGGAEPVADLLTEVIGWRVRAARGSPHTRSRRGGIFELHSETAAGWWLDRVID